MQKLKFINAKGIEINFTSGNYGITDWSGLSADDLNIQTQQVPFQDGSVFLDALMQERTISIVLAINDEKNLNKRYELRRELISILNPKLGEGTLIYENDFLQKQIKAIPQLPIFANKNADKGGTNKADISFFCCSPYWEDVEETIVGFNLTKRGYIENKGDVETEVEMEIITTGVTNPTIRNITTGKKIELLGEFNDTIHIDTNSGKKSVYNELYKFKVFGDTLQNMSIIYPSKLNLFITIGYGKILTSTDGVNWICEDINTLNGKSIRAITYSSELNLFVVVGDNGTILTSTDGVNWTSRVSDTTALLTSITYSSELNLFVAVGNTPYGSSDGGTILTSSDGVNWTKIDTSSTYLWYVYFNSIIYSSELNLFVAVGNHKYSSMGFISTSLDGETWETTEIDTTFDLNSIAYSSELNLFVAVGNNGTILTSSDGVNWISRNSGTSGNLRAITYSSKLNLFVVVGDNGIILTSTDGTNWTSSDSGTSGNLREVIYSSELNLFVAVGDNGIILTSTGGVNWTDTSYVTLQEFINSIAYSSELNLFVGVGDYGKILTSSDSIHWISRNSGTSGNLRAITYSSKLNLFVVVGDNGIILTSTDGTNWTSSDSGTSGNLREVIYSSELNLFVAVGGPTSPKLGENQCIILTSPDGVNWTSRDSGRDGYLRAITYSSKLNLFVAVGSGIPGSTDYDGKILTSPDGVNWTSRDSGISFGLFSIDYSDDLNLFVALVISQNDSPDIIISSDGINWTSKIWNYHNINNSGEHGEIYYSSELNLFISNSGGILQVSSDGINWKKLGIFNSSSTLIVKNYTIYSLGEISVYSIKEDTINEISKLSADSDMNFNLSVGENELFLNYDGGSANAVIKFRNKYVGV